VIVWSGVLAKRLNRGLRATFTGLAVNAVLAGSKLVAGLMGHSHALVADAIESLADVFSSIVVWRGLVVASVPADEDHPYGHGKAEPIAAAVVSTMLLMGSLLITVQAVRAALHPHSAPAAVTLIVLGVAVVVKEGLFRFVRRESAAIESSAMHADAWHHRSDAITSLCAAIGISVAVLGGKGYEVADDIAAVAAAAIIGWNGWRLLRKALNELMDRAPRGEVVDQIRDIAQRAPGVARVEKCFVRKMGYQYFVDMHVEVDPQMTVARAHSIAHDVKNRVREALPKVRDVMVHIEPASGGAAKR
jgi:cation diffusion facilitator family transporter